MRVPDIWPGLNHLGPEERSSRELQGLWNYETISDILERRALRRPDAPAIFTADRVLSYRDLVSLSSSISKTLFDEGVRPGDVVCWMLPTGPEAVAVASAVWRIGAVSSPIVPVNGVAEMASILSDVEPHVVLTQETIGNRQIAEEFDRAIADAGVTVGKRLLMSGQLAGWRSATSAGPGTIPISARDIDPMKPALILFTSGTESTPKAVVHHSVGLNHEIRSTSVEWGLGFTDRMFMASPMTHITGLLQGFLIPVRLGASAILMDKWEATEGLELIERFGGTFMAGAAPFLRELLAAYRTSGREKSSLRQYCSGGASVHPDLVLGIEEFGVAAYRCWGMTELPTSTLANEQDSLEKRSTTDGKVAPGVEVRVVDETGNTIDDGSPGELLLKGPELMLGYLRPEHNAGAFTQDGWFSTGDIGTVDNEGFVQITGRKKEIINRGGEKFSAREIEDVVLKHPDVISAAVVPVAGGRLGERIGLAIVSRRESIQLAEICQTVLEAGLSNRKQPEELVVVETMPTNAMGKIDKKAVSMMFTSS